MRQFFILVVLTLGFTAANAQEEDSTWKKAYVDTAILGDWKMENPAQMKMLRSMRDLFLREQITFKDREVYEVYHERHPWAWNFSERFQTIEIADLETETIKRYKLKYLDENKLILLVGKQEIIFKKVQ